MVTAATPIRAASPAGTAQRRADTLFRVSTRCMAYAPVVAVILLGLLLLATAWPALREFHWHFLASRVWDPVAVQFGALPFLVGTLLTCVIAAGIATPLGIGAAIFIQQLAPLRIRAGIAMLVDLLAAIPSVIYGLWGLFVIVPLMRTHVEPWMIRVFGALPFFDGPAFGIGVLCAGCIVAIMILPIIAALSRELFATAPIAQHEAVLALGATRWEAIRMAVLAPNQIGVFGAVCLGLGRALGETMAVTMVIGNRADFPASIFAPGQTMASLIANEFAEATDPMHRSALCAVALLLFVVSLLINLASRVMVNRLRGAAHSGVPGGMP